MTTTDNPRDEVALSGPGAGTDDTHDRHLSTDQLATEWVERCIDLLRPMDWAGRMAALMQLHDQLRNDFVDFEVFCRVFPVFISRIIDELGVSPVEELNQAHVYANSASDAHRKAARGWLIAHGQPAP